MLELVERIEKVREQTMKILDELESVYSQMKDTASERKTSEEIEAVNEQVYHELSQARVILLGHVNSLHKSSNVGSGESLSYSEAPGSSGQVGRSNEMGNTSNWCGQRANDSFSSTSNAVNGQLERIRISFFGGNKMDFPRWHAAFSSQFKMLRLEGCLTGEAAETIKGLGNSEAAYETAKARLLRKYGGSRRQVQGHLEELKNIKVVREDDAKALEKFADVLERTVINLKENYRQSDLADGTLYTIVLEKIPEKLLSQYYRWIKENRERESLEKLKDWVAEEAEYQIQASETRNGIGSDAKTNQRQDGAMEKK